MTTAPLATAISPKDVDADAAVALLQALVRLQPEGEAAVQTLVQQRLEQLGVAVEAIAFEPASVPVIKEFASRSATAAGERRSMVATFRGRGGGRNLLIFAHPDAELVPAAVDWEIDPFAGVESAGRIHGWGIADDLAGVAAAIAAMDLLARAGIRLNGDVVIASTPSKRHARGVAALLHHGYDADAALYLHPAESGMGMHEVKAMASGQLEFAITVSGCRPQTSEPGHTAFSHLAVNPLDKALLLIEALRQHATARAERIHHPRLEAAVGRSTNIMLSSLSFGDGEVLSQLPETLTFGGAVSFPPDEAMEAVQHELAAVLAAAAGADPWLREHPPLLRWVSGVSGIEVAEADPFYRTVEGAVQQVCGYVPRVNAMHTSSDIRNPMVQKGIPTLGLGPLCGDLTHSGGRHEWVDRADYIASIAVAAAIIVDWCGVAA